MVDQIDINPSASKGAHLLDRTHPNVVARHAMDFYMHYIITTCD